MGPRRQKPLEQRQRSRRELEAVENHLEGKQGVKADKKEGSSPRRTSHALLQHFLMPYPAVGCAEPLKNYKKNELLKGKVLCWLKITFNQFR